ncbi:LacI family DNA-binding transcriptional regulator [Halobacillus rhizosphaerae]|uniref:LacI family DNA-binding transcriptional regulator n=1 Tax=Halobacillus rhizosphaerae TaxID=3064889 RepID=UPI00398AA83A
MIPRDINIKFIAEQANVSIATVSNVINQKGRVSQKTAVRVRQVIEEYRYRGNLAARNLRTNRSYLFGLVVALTKPEDKLHDNPFYWDLVSGIESAVRENEFVVALKGVSSKEELSSFIRERSLDGLIVVGAHEGSILVEQVKEFDMPTVYIDCYLNDPSVYQIHSDDHDGGYKAARHLIDLGHREICLLSGEITPNTVNYFRWKGYKKALQEQGIYDHKKLIETETSAHGGYTALSGIIEQFPEVTAMVTFSDITALGLYKGLNERGYRIPEDYSITGFDGTYFAEYIIPALTTIKQDIGLKGVTAVQLLFDQMDGKTKETNRVSLPVALCRGSSTAPRPAFE